MDPRAPSEGESVGICPAISDERALHYRRWEPARPSPRATLAVLSGVMSHSAWFRPLARRWQPMGYRVVGVDRRGSGLNRSMDGGQGGSAQSLVDDARRVIEHGTDWSRPLILVGWCWGAILGVHLAQALGERLTGFAMLTPGLYPSAMVAERMKALGAQLESTPADAMVLPSPITDEMFTRGPALAAFVRRDEIRWRRLSPRFVAVSNQLSMVARMRLRQLTVPLWVALAQDDVTTDNDKIITELARLPVDRVRTRVFPGSHGLQFETPQALAQQLDDWARDTLGV